MKPPPAQDKSPPFPERLFRRKRWLAFLSMLAERVTLHFWKPSIWILAFAALWLFEIPAMGGAFTEKTVALVFWGGFIHLAASGALSFRVPDQQSVIRRIENDSELAHQPLSLLTDKPAGDGSELASALWQKARNRALAFLPALRVRMPGAFMAVLDPRALRIAVTLLFATALVMAGSQASPRIRHGLSPFSLPETGTQDTPRVRITITPPEYTRLQPLSFDEKTAPQKALGIPESSTVKVIVNGGFLKPSLIFPDNKLAFQPSGDSVFTIEAPLENRDGFFTVRQFPLTYTRVNYRVTKDSPPEIAMTGSPVVLPGGAIRFPLSVKDDYGTKSISLSMALDPQVSEPPLTGKPYAESRIVVSPPGKDMAASPLYDLTAHIWAGLPVVFTLSVSDGSGQSAALPPIPMALPERGFRHPSSKALAAMRQSLAHNPADNYAQISGGIEDIMTSTARFNNDLIAFLGLRSAASRLFYSDASPETAQSEIPLLWDLALRLEDGDLSLAAQKLKDAQNALEAALDEAGATPDDIARKMAALRESLAAYMNEISRELQKQIESGEAMPLIPPEMAAQMAGPDALSEFLDKIEDAMRAGDMEAARQMLSQLQQFTQGIDPSMAAPMPADMQAMAEGGQALTEIIKLQKILLSKTLNDVRIDDTDPGRAMEQEAIRKALNDVLLEIEQILDNVPENMHTAEEEMQFSAENLRLDDLASAVVHQEEALKYLEQSQQNLGQQLGERMQQMTGMSLGNMRLDPLGRPYGQSGGPFGFNPASNVRVPEGQEKKKTDQIRNLLRERAGDFSRPDDELDYYRRLLRQF